MRRSIHVKTIGGGGPTVYLYDTFTDANGTTLPAHTMNVGGGWTAQPANIGGSTAPFTIQSNNSQAPGGLHTLTTADATVSDGILTFDILYRTGSCFGGVVVRFANSNSYWVFALQNDTGTNPYIALYKCTGSGVFSSASGQILSTIPTPGTYINCTVTLNGALMSMTTNTGESISQSTDTTGLTNTLMGMSGYDDFVGYTPGLLIDNFKFTSL